jgi:hypothetical protein
VEDGMTDKLTDLEIDQSKDIILLRALLQRAAEALEPFAAFPPNPQELKDETYCRRRSFKAGEYRRAGATLAIIKEFLK